MNWYPFHAATMVAICPDKILGTTVSPSNLGAWNPGWCCDGTTQNITDCKVTVRDIDAKWRTIMAAVRNNAALHAARCGCVNGVPDLRKCWETNTIPLQIGGYCRQCNDGHTLNTVTKLCVSDTAVVTTPLTIVNKPTEQATSAVNGLSNRAVDGNKANGWGQGSCTHTTTMTNPWWQVDLQQTASVTKVKVTNRAYCCGSRLDGFKVRVGNSAAEGNTATAKWDAVQQNAVCESPGDPPVSSVPQGAVDYAVVCAAPITGRYVQIVIPGNSKTLTLCEVEVEVAS